jgi:hypothetical protein
VDHEHCPPTKVSISIAGYPGIAAGISAALEVGARLTNRFRLVATGQPAEAGLFEITAPTPLGTIELRPQRRSRLLVDKGLRRFADKRVIHEEKSEEQEPPPRSDGAIPLRNGRFIRGL